MNQRITLNEDTAAIMARLSKHTGLSVAGIANRLLGGLLPDMHEIDAFLDAHPTGSLREQGANLIQSYGPETLMEGLARIAPAYEMLAARFEREMREAIAPASKPLQ